MDFLWEKFYKNMEIEGVLHHKYIYEKIDSGRHDRTI